MWEKLWWPLATIGAAFFIANAIDSIGGGLRAIAKAMADRNENLSKLAKARTERQERLERKAKENAESAARDLLIREFREKLPALRARLIAIIEESWPGEKIARTGSRGSWTIRVTGDSPFAEEGEIKATFTGPAPGDFMEIGLRFDVVDVIGCQALELLGHHKNCWVKNHGPGYARMCHHAFALDENAEEMIAKLVRFLRENPEGFSQEDTPTEEVSEAS